MSIVKDDDMLRSAATATDRDDNTLGPTPELPGAVFPGELQQATRLSLYSSKSQISATNDQINHAPRRAIFADSEAMKKQVREKAFKQEYNVKQFYKKKGIWPAIATSPTFEIATLVVIGLNSIWLWIDSDLNDEPVLLDADWPFQLAENSFCVFFFFEWTVRFLSFEDKWNCLHDAWFMFDSVLVGLMVFETWFMTILIAATSSSGGGMGNTSVLRLLRLMRLTRISRLARLLRAMPELLVMIKGMLAATRSVALTILLLVFILYVFGIVERLLSNDTEAGRKYFPSVPTAMGNLIIHGALLDNVGTMMSDLSGQPLCAIAYALVIMLAALTMMNMLVGVLCEVVSAVSATEKEEMAVSSVKNKISQILKDRLIEVVKEYDTTPTKKTTSKKNVIKEEDLIIAKDDFVAMVKKEEAVIALKEVGIDADNLIDYAKIMFQSDERGKAFDARLTLPMFLELALKLRSTNPATVKDISDLRKFIHEQNTNRNKRLKDLIGDAEQLEGAYRKLASRQRGMKERIKRIRTAMDIQGKHVTHWYGVPSDRFSDGFRGSITAMTVTPPNGDQYAIDLKAVEIDEKGRLKWPNGDIWIQEETLGPEHPQGSENNLIKHETSTGDHSTLHCGQTITEHEMFATDRPVLEHNHRNTELAPIQEIVEPLVLVSLHSIIEGSTDRPVLDQNRGKTDLTPIPESIDPWELVSPDSNIDGLLKVGDHASLHRSVTQLAHEKLSRQRRDVSMRLVANITAMVLATILEQSNSKNFDLDILKEKAIPIILERYEDVYQESLSRRNSKESLAQPEVKEFNAPKFSAHIEHSIDDITTLN